MPPSKAPAAAKLSDIEPVQRGQEISSEQKLQIIEAVANKSGQSRENALKIIGVGDALVQHWIHYVDRIEEKAGRPLRIDLPGRPRRIEEDTQNGVRRLFGQSTADRMLAEHRYDMLAHNLPESTPIGGALPKKKKAAAQPAVNHSSIGLRTPKQASADEDMEEAMETNASGGKRGTVWRAQLPSSEDAYGRTASRTPATRTRHASEAAVVTLSAPEEAELRALQKAISIPSAEAGKHRRVSEATKKACLRVSALLQKKQRGAAKAFTEQWGITANLGNWRKAHPDAETTAIDLTNLSLVDPVAETEDAPSGSKGSRGVRAPLADDAVGKTASYANGALQMGIAEDGNSVSVTIDLTKIDGNGADILEQVRLGVLHRISNMQGGNQSATARVMGISNVTVGANLKKDLPLKQDQHESDHAADDAGSSVA